MSVERTTIYPTAQITAKSCLYLKKLQFTWASDLYSLYLGCFRSRGLDEHNFVSDEDAVSAVCGGRLVGRSRQPAASSLWSQELLVARDGGSDEIDRTGVAGK